MLKRSLLLLCAAVTLSACAGVKVTKTYVATGATHPRSIYIRPFSVANADFRGHQGSPGELDLRRSLAPAEFASALQEELAKIAPAQVLKPNEVPRGGSGWLVTGELEVVDAGSPTKRLFIGTPFGAGRSHILIHVRVIDVGHHSAHEYGSKKEVANDTLSPRSTPLGDVIYEFDVAGGSHLSGKLGSVYAPGAGYATPFDFRNAAERIMIALSPDPYRYGTHTSPTTY